MEDWLAVSSVVTLEPLDTIFKKPVQVTIPSPLYSGTRNVDIQPSLRLLCCFPVDSKATGPQSPNYQWRDITDSTPLTVMNECARFSTSQPARYGVKFCLQTLHCACRDVSGALRGYVTTEFLKWKLDLF